MEYFTNEVCEKIGYYVYRLVDPRNGETFYVGKGKGNRVFNHVDWAKKGLDSFKINEKEEDAQSLKIQRIQDILYEGLEVIHIIHRWGMTETEALLVESALMDAYPGLTNIQGGYHCDNGVVSTHSLQKRFESEVFVDRDDIKYLIIKIRKSVIEDRGSVYEAVRRAWKISIDNAQNYPYVLAVENGIVKGVFEVDYWYKSQEIGRCEFIGKNAHKGIEDYFLNKRIPEKYCKKGMSSPVLYGKN